MRPPFPTVEEGEDGSIALFVAIIGVALLAIAGLVTDGGLALQARARASDLAQACARAGTRGLDVATLRDTGQLRISSSQAQAAVSAYEANAGVSAAQRCDQIYTETVGGQVRVHAHVSITTDTDLLRLVGISSLTEQESAEAAVTQALPR